MKLSELLKGLEYTAGTGKNYPSAEGEKGVLPADCEISGIENDSRKAAEGRLFVCVRGANSDGHAFAAAAAKQGCAAILVDSKADLSALDEKSAEQLIVVRVPDTRYAMAVVSAAFYGHPGDRLKVIGVTGTKGKTTTTYLIKSILEKAGIRTGLIGTIESVIGEEHIPASNTTPESLLLQQTFAKMVEKGIQVCVMEVSSQALKLHRTAGFMFDTAVFTNIEPDHIGPNEHADFAEYLYCKSLLFRQCRYAIVNGDDPHTGDILKDSVCGRMSFGLGKDNDLRAGHLELTRNPGELGIAFDTDGMLNMHVEIPTPGKFSVYNALCAIAVADHMGVSGEAVVSALRTAKVKGRIEMVKVSDTFTMMIDYAHNAMALESLLTTLKEYDPHRLICLFGCGGNRSRLRRFEMGEVSGKLADFTVITSDNPRNEEPLDIIRDIVTGMQKTDGKYIEIPDRKEAIRYCILNGEPGDIVVLAGKGHEDYQEIRGVKYPMDERVIIKDILREENIVVRD